MILVRFNMVTLEKHTPLNNMSGEIFFEIKSHVLCDNPFCTNSHRKNRAKIAIYTANLTVPYVCFADSSTILSKNTLNINICLKCYDLFQDAQIKEIPIYDCEFDFSTDILKKAFRKTMNTINKYEINPSRYLLD